MPNFQRVFAMSHRSRQLRTIVGIALPIEPNSVYTLELGTETSRGYVGLEDEVLVSASGATWLSTAQTELIMAG